MSHWHQRRYDRTLMLTLFRYIIDSYEVYAASALASITLIRYVAAGGMTIVGIPFYKVSFHAHKDLDSH